MEPRLPARYAALEPPRQGGEALVWRAFDHERGQVVALKAARPGQDPAVARLRQRRELATLAELGAPGWPQGLDAGELPDGTPFVTMAWVEGEDLAGPLPEAAILGWLPGLVGALGRLHARGLVHGDLSAANVRLTPAGEAVVLDLGHLDRPGPVAAPGGTLAALAPEVLGQGLRDRRADLYALGCVLYRAATGRDPFVGTPEEVVRGHLEGLPRPPRQLVPGLGAAFEAAVLRLLAKDPADRFQDGAALLAALGLAAGRPAGGALLEAPLAGREDALAALDQPLAWLVGPAGAGRTRLLAAARARGWAAGQVVVDVRAAGAAPLSALAAPLRALAELAGTSAAPLLAAATSAIPEGPRERLRLAAAVAELARAALPARALWLVDDHDRLDALSREVLACVRRSGGDRPWRWVLAGEHAEADAPAVVLAPLGAAALADLAGAALGGALPPALAEPLLALSGGWPGRARALLAAWLREGVLGWDERGWQARDLGASADLGTGDAPAGISAGARELAGLAAVLGEAGPLAGLQALADAELPGWPAAWGELVARGVLVEAGSRFQFASVAVQLACRATLPLGRRQALQARAHAWLAATRPAGLEDLVTLARLAVAAGLPDAAGWALRAARAALSLHEVDLADELVRDLVAKDEEVALELALLAAQVARARGAIVPAREAYEGGLLARLAARGDARLAYHQVSLGVLHQLAGSYEAAARAYEAAVAAGGPPDALLRAHVFAGRTATFRGLADEAGRHFEAALALARDPAVARWRGWALGSYGQWLEARGGAERERGLALLGEAVAANRAVHDVYLLHEALNNLGNAHLAAGELAPAAAAFRECREICGRFGLLNERAFGLLNGAAVALDQGDLLAAQEDARAALASARAQGRRYPEGLALAYLGLALVHAGEAAAGLAELDQAAGLAGAIANRYLELTVLALRAEAELALEHLPAAREAWQAATRLAAETANQEHRGRLDRVALGLAVLGNEPGALAAAEAATRAPHPYAGHPAAAHYWLGRASGALAAFTQAEELAAGHGLLALEASYQRGLLAPPAEAPGILAAVQAAARASGRPALAARAAAALAARQGDEGARREALRRLAELAAPLGEAVPTDPGEALAAAALGRLSGVLDEMGAAPDPEAVAARALAALLAVTGAERALLVEYNGLAVTRRQQAGAREDGAEAFSRTLAHRVVVEGRPLFIADVQADQDLARAPSVRELGLRSFVGLPLVLGGAVVGALIADSRRLLPLPGPTARAELAALARHAARALASSRRLAAAERDGRSARAALELARAVLGWHPAEAVDYLLAAAVTRGGAVRGWLLVGPELAVAAERGEPGGVPPHEPAGWVLAGGRPLQLPMEEPGGGSLVLVPVGKRGVLALERAPGVVAPVPLDLLVEVAELLAGLAAPLPQGAT